MVFFTGSLRWYFFICFLFLQVHQDALLARQKLVLQALFEKWDNDGSGFLELEEVDGVLTKYKEGMELEAMAKGKMSLKKAKIKVFAKSHGDFADTLFGLYRY